MNVYCVPVEAIDPIWSRVQSFFEKALSKHDAEYSLSDVKQALLDGKWKLFAFFNDKEMLDGAAVISFIPYPKSHVAFVTCIGGKTLINKEYYEKFTELLKGYGADRLQGYVGNSVERLCRRIGMAHKTSVIETRL